jgi:hypothetical protein
VGDHKNHVRENTLNPDLGVEKFEVWSLKRASAQRKKI